MKARIVLISTVVLALLLAIVVPALAAPASFSPPRAIDWAALWQMLITTYQPYVLTLLGLILLDLLSGIGSAIKAGTFQWVRVADFYRTAVMPSLIGWVAVTLASYFIAPSLLGDYANLGSQTFSTIFWAAAVASLAASALKNLADIAGVQLNLPMSAKPKPPL